MEVSTSFDRTMWTSSQSGSATNSGGPLAYMYSQPTHIASNASCDRLNTPNTQTASDNVRAMDRSGMNTTQTCSAASKNIQKRPAPSIPAPQLNNSSNATIVSCSCQSNACNVSRANATISSRVNVKNVARPNTTSPFRSSITSMSSATKASQPTVSSDATTFSNMANTFDGPNKRTGSKSAVANAYQHNTTNTHQSSVETLQRFNTSRPHYTDQPVSETSRVTSSEHSNISFGGSSQSIPTSLSLENKTEPHSWAVFKKVRLYLLTKTVPLVYYCQKWHHFS